MCEQMLNKLEMKRIGVIKMGPDRRLILTADKQCTWKRGIYAWVEVDIEDRPKRVLYVGKAGKTIAARCRQHTNGLADTKSKVNCRNALALRDAFDRKSHILIYGRESATAMIFGRNVTMNDAEEEAAIYVLEPTINSRKDVEMLDLALITGAVDLPI